MWLSKGKETILAQLLDKPRPQNLRGVMLDVRINVLSVLHPKNGENVLHVVACKLVGFFKASMLLFIKQVVSAVIKYFILFYFGEIFSNDFFFKLQFSGNVLHVVTCKQI